MGAKLIQILQFSTKICNFAAKFIKTSQMDSNKPLILVSNDDGYDYNGIKSLIKVARSLGDVFVVAPAVHQSGMSSAITFVHPVRTTCIAQEEGYTAYLATGTPADCVKLALSQLMADRMPDVVLAGINHGYNSGLNTLYSGTMACAFEGILHGVPSVAFSFGNYSADADTSACEPIVKHVTERVLKGGLPKDVCLNVNIPDIDGQFRGMKVTTGDMGRWINEWEHRVDPTGRNYYWLTGEFEIADKNEGLTDYYWLQRGYVTVTPTHVDQTDHASMDTIKDLLL